MMLEKDRETAILYSCRAGFFLHSALEDYTVICDVAIIGNRDTSNDNTQESKFSGKFFTRPNPQPGIYTPQIFSRPIGTALLIGGVDEK